MWELEFYTEAIPRRNKFPNFTKISGYDIIDKRI